MGAVIPIAIIIVSALSATAAVYAAVTIASTILIILAVVSVAATVASVVAYATGDVKLAMMFAAIGIVSGVGAVYLAAASQSATAMALLAEGTASSVAAAEAAYSSGVLVITGYINAVSAGFQSFLEAIHFKTLMGIHQVAYLISTDYRETVQKIWGQISEVSAALGMTADWMGLVLRDTKHLVLDVSSMLGQSYDLGEVAYMQSLSSYLGSFSKEAHRYQNNPSLLLWDLDQWVTKPAIDAKAATVQVWLATVEKTVAGVKLLAEDVTRVRNDIMKLVADLPEFLKKHIAPFLTPLIKQLDDFMRLTYDPAMKLISGSITTLQADQATAKKQIQGTVDRLSRPGRLLREIKSLPPAQRAEDEADVADLAASAPSRTAVDLEDLADVSRAIIDADIAAEIPAYEPAVPELPEIKPAPLPAEKAVPKITTPFVGEF